jgi:predicted nucleic acid-binding protein
MRLGIDTGFFVALANDQPRAHEFWLQLHAGQHLFVVSSLTICEIVVYFYQRGNGNRASEWMRLLTELDHVEIVPVSVGIALGAAAHRHSLGLPTVDSIILSTFLTRQCELMLSTDHHFARVAERGLLAVEFLPSS